jgi:anaerobic magnesium-protoporphyrin IX monomethyl ester cyclase
MLRDSQSQSHVNFRVLLVQPHTMLDEPPIYPLGLSILAACLGDRDVRIVDMNVLQKPVNTLVRILREYSPDVVGLSIRNIKNVRPGMHVSTLEGHLRAIRTIRAERPDVPLVAGGAAFSLYARRFLERFPEIDLGVFGEGERSFPELLERLERPQAVSGIYHRRNGKIEFTGRRPRLEMDGVPAPRWDLLDPAPYAGEVYGVGVQSKRGCLMRCVHCSDLYLLGRRLHLREPARVADEVEALRGRFGVRRFMFADQLFNVPQEHAAAICEEIIRRQVDVEWTAWFHEGNLSPGLVSLCRAAGCVRMVFSPDAAHDRVLSLWGKGITRADMDSAVELCRRERMQASFNFMPNGPGDGVTSVLSVVGFIVRARLRLGKLLRPAGGLFSRMRIYPHTRLQALALREGHIGRDNDLLEPVFYDPYPLKVLVAPIRGIVAMLWRARRVLRTLLARGPRD